MEVVNIDGVEYMKAAVAAKKFKYTPDYVGQLCRARKIDAKLVGRTWYVNIKSLETHKTGRFVKENLNEKTIDNKTKSEESRLDVEPVMRGATVKIVAATEDKSSNFSKRMAWSPVKYQEDGTDLLPGLTKVESAPTRLPVNMAEATKIIIKKDTKPIFMEAEDLPEVFLRGTLKVNSMDTDYDNNIENIAIPEEKITSLKINPTQKQETRTKERWHKVAMTRTESDSESKPKEPVILESQALYAVEVNIIKDSLDKGKENIKEFTPTRFRGRSTQIEIEAKKVPVWLWLSLSVSVLLLIATAVLEISVLADSATYRASIILAI